tara:strand:+ start:879 stop:1187 length:309 start_codon:yes stop_codon:yes gene_type:complete
MEIITKLPNYSDRAINDARLAQLTSGLELKKAQEGKQEAQAAHQAKEDGGSNYVPGLGRRIAVIPQWEFFRMIQKYGHERVHSKEFMSYYQKTYPHLSPEKL